MKLKLALYLSLTILTSKAQDPLILTNAFYNIGTNGYDAFCVTVLNAQTNTAYGWEESTNLLNNWSLTFPQFVGNGQSMSFYETIDQGDTNRFYRIITIAPIISTPPTIVYTNSVSVRTYPSTNFPPFPN